MKHKITCIALVFALLLLAAGPVCAHEYDRNDSDHPLRYAAYLVHPIGILGEYAITRPIHLLVSLPHACIIFGHDPRPGMEPNNWVWK
ncbi:hypothetical protein JW916_10900 [Candidatus Sumerlaeota bacterium]|nr:hypothetical protein [Candidatus Sumerlaeota bacterium]